MSFHRNSLLLQFSLTTSLVLYFYVKNFQLESKYHCIIISQRKNVLEKLLETLDSRLESQDPSLWTLDSGRQTLGSGLLILDRHWTPDSSL